MTPEIDKKAQTKALLIAERNLRIFVPSMETFESDDVLRILLDVPGLDPNSITVECDDGILRVEGLVGVLGVDLKNPDLRPCVKTFRESFDLPPDLDEQGIEVDFFDGTLQITVPRLFFDESTGDSPSQIH